MPCFLYFRSKPVYCKAYHVELYVRDTMVQVLWNCAQSLMFGDDVEADHHAVCICPQCIVCN